MLEKLRVTYQLAAMIIIGLFLILVGTFSAQLHTLAVDFLGLSPTSGLAKFLNEELKEAKWIGSTLFIGGFVIYFLATGIEKFFEKRISPIIKDHVDRLSNELSEVSSNTKDLLSARLLDGVIDTTSRKVIRDKLQDLHSKAYGNHCASDKGLYYAVQEKMGPFYFTDKTHRSDYNQTVTIVDNDDGSITWHEVCGYKIHSVCFDQDYVDVECKKISHHLRYGTLVKTDQISFEGEDTKYQLTISVDDKEIFNTKNDLCINDGQVCVNVKVDGVTIDQTKDNLKITLDRYIDITKAWTKVEIKESSIIYDEDFISRRHDPTCGAKININLPEYWTFESVVFGHPLDWEINQHPPHTLSASTQKWVLPGITFYCKWQKPVKE